MRRLGVRLATLAAIVLSATSLALAAERAEADDSVTASVADTPTGRAMPPGFVGVSMEFSAVRAYTGSDPRAINPVLVHLLRALAPGQAPVLRIGGNSADETWWPMRGMKPPAFVNYALTPGWMQTTGALAAALRAELLVGVNLAAGRPSLAAAEERALRDGVGPYIRAFEVGNEPDLYSFGGMYRSPARGPHYNLAAFTSDFSRWAAAMPGVPLAGPALAMLNWLPGLGQFLAKEPALRVVTVHRYPLRACVTNPIAPGYPTIPALLDDASATGIAQAFSPYVSVVHARHLPFRVGEMNSASCTGRAGVSDTFAAALWVLDTLFNLANVGVDGVNIHTLPSAPYQLFSFSRPQRVWRAFVHPEYYGMLLFAQAFPPGANLLPVTAPTGPVKIWATRSTTQQTRVVLINKGTSSTQVTLQVPGAGGPASLEWLTAPSLSSTAGVTLGGRSFGTSTTTGRLPAFRTTPITASGGAYSITMPPGSAALLTQ